MIYLLLIFFNNLYETIKLNCNLISWHFYCIVRVKKKESKMLKLSNCGILGRKD